MIELEEPERGAEAPPRDGAETGMAADPEPVGDKGPMYWVRGLSRVLLFFVCLALFLVAIELIKNGATGAAGLIERYLDINSPVNALGFGWSASYLVMSGSPVAAVSVGIVDGKPRLDLDYPLDVRADVYMNIAMNHRKQFIEVQGTAEQATFGREQLDTLLDMAEKGISKLIRIQRAALRPD